MEKIKLALFSECFGTHPYGGPVIRHANICKVLDEYGVDFTLFTNNNKIHPDYNVVPERTKTLLEFKKEDFNVYWVEQGFNSIKMLNRLGIEPIIGSNVLPCRAPEHCLPYLDEAGKLRQPKYAISEPRWMATMKGKFWLSQSDFQEKEYRDLGLNWNTPVYRCNNPVDIRVFKPMEREPNKRFTIGWTGKNNWAKHPEFLKRIAQALPGVDFKYFSDEIPNWTDTPNLKFVTGNTNKSMPEQLNSCDAFISTSVTENQPLGVLEAMACGLPVITFRTSGMPDIITHKENGLMVDLGNIQHFVVEIQRLIMNRELQEKLSKNGRYYVVEYFSHEACIQDYYSFLDKYLEG